jgi:hypothetical protein
MELTGEPVPVVQQIGTGPNHAHFNVSASGLLVFRTGPGDITQLTWRDRQGKVLQSIGEPGPRPTAITLSPDESRVVLFRSDAITTRSGDLWVLDPSRNIETRITFGQKASINPGPSRPVWSPDGKQIAYFSEDKFFVKPSSGAGEARLLFNVGHVAQPTDWSRDGKYLLYHEPVNGNLVLKVVSVNEGGTLAEPSVVLQSGGGATLSPDGRWVAYVSQESGQFEVYIQPFHAPGQQDSRAGAKWQVSRDGGFNPRWRADGKELFFAAPTSALMSAAIEVSGDTLRPSAPVSLFAPALTNGVQWEVSRDGQRILVAAPLDRGNETPITVVENWEASLKR